ncbi:MAG TPA: metallophosphoesterase, partial [Flavisolibacter sp.]|nr:metallophosphoesterase [Flavisolibacter sp.]
MTDRPFNNDTAKIQFAIVSDLWGGNRPGIFEDAVEKLELLQPQFVMSVGDLIDGKTYDSTVVDEQWKDFDQKIKPLSMPFFYVPGNHDIGNPMMERQWTKRLGAAYYHFVYKNALFITINTEDGGRSGISDEQVNYFKKILADNSGVRWTFLFMHRPVWFGKSEKKEGYEKIEAALTGRNYTLFSGHHHTYSMMVQNGNKHFILGSTGGGSDLRGEKFGEYDHITMVTLDKNAPTIVNLKLDGIIKEDVVNANTYPLTQTLI